MSAVRIYGVVALVVGILLLGFGLNSTQSITQKIAEKMTGHYTETTMLDIILGVALIIGGGAFAFKGFFRKD